MKFTLSWLKQHLDTTADLQTITDKLTALGLEVESVTDGGKILAPFIIAHVIEAVQHPNADRLRVCTVDTGKEKLQVVCGAPNARAGLKTVLARPGDVMPDSGEALKKGTIRGVESQGMLCAADELNLPATETSGIIELPADAPIGESFAKFAGYDDPVIEINLTPNRPDCAGVYGIARDLAAAGVGTLKPLDAKPVPGAEPSRVKVTLDFPDGDNTACPLFVGRLIRNIENRPSPAWLQRRLQAIGLRPISALVDITNLLTFDAMRPLHVFDAKKLKGNIRLYSAKGGENFAALNGKTYTLAAGMTAIGDDSGVISLAGIMGGEATSCDAATTEVFIESALFDAARTARTGRALQINSDARYRFERGVDPAFTVPGIELATKLVLELCGTPQTVVANLEIAGKEPPARSAIHFDLAQTQRRTGVDVPHEAQKKILQSLGFKLETAGDKLNITPPSWRPDIEGAADLVEEIVRVVGYDGIPATSLPVTAITPGPAIDQADIRLNAARRALAAQGLMEAVTWSFMPSAIAAHFGTVHESMRLLNPISADLDVMRPTLLGNLMQAASRNATRGFADAALFEVGPIFKDITPEGQTVMAATVRAGHTPRNWLNAARPVDAFDAKADAMAALAACGAPASLQVTTDAPAWYHPGRSGALRLGPTLLAYFGEIHPAILQACDIKGPVVAAEIFPAAIPPSRASGTAKPLLKLETLQPVTRDFAFVMAREVTAAKLIRAVRDADKNLIRDVTLFDLYEGEHVGADQKSVAFSVTLQPLDRTLTDAEIDAVATRITASVTKATGATLRG